MIQDILPHRFNNRFAPNMPGDDDFIFIFRNNELLLLQQGEGFAFPRRKMLNHLMDTGTYLFSIDDTSCFLTGECEIKDPDLVYREINFFRTISHKEVAWASIVALQLMHWYQQNKFCGRCGHSMKHKEDERAMVCSDCGNTVYPKISPAIIVAVLSKKGLLLARGVNFRAGFHSLVAGYTDIGESLEDAVAREVKEEVGLEVFNIRYYKSQPWPLSGSIMVGFIAEADADEPIKIDPKEISEAAWYNRDNLPSYPPSAISIAGEMIENFKNGSL